MRQALRRDTRPGIAPESLRSEEHTSELQSRRDIVCRLLLEKKKKAQVPTHSFSVAAMHGNHPETLFSTDTATTEIYTLSLHDALPILGSPRPAPRRAARAEACQNRSKTCGKLSGAIPGPVSRRRA